MSEYSIKFVYSASKHKFPICDPPPFVVIIGGATAPTSLQVKPPKLLGKAREAFEGPFSKTQLKRL